MATDCQPGTLSQALHPGRGTGVRPPSRAGAPGPVRGHTVGQGRVGPRPLGGAGEE